MGCCPICVCDSVYRVEQNHSVDFLTDSIKYVMGKNLMKKFLFGAFAAVCAAFSLAAVNINTASSAELEALPGIGPAKAKAIVEYRQKNGAFKSVEELKNVKGIGDAVLNKLKAEATVSPAAPKAAQPAVKK